MKEQLIKKLETQLNEYSTQPASDEFLNIQQTIDAVKNADISKLEEKAENLINNYASCWLNIWTNGTIRRIYLNACYKNGTKLNLKDNYINF